ncbi:MAG TPA: hypothetical protein VIO58_10880 [Candidatus Methanoperedens sp.]
MLKVKSTEKGIFIPHELVDLPPGTEFSIHKGKYHITLEPEGLTNKTVGLVRIGKIDIDEEIGRMVESKVVG